MAPQSEAIVLDDTGTEAEQTAIGAGTSAGKMIRTTPTRPDPELTAISGALEVLAQAIAARRQVADAAGLADRARELAGEVMKPAPERGRIERLLAMLTAGTKPVGDLAFSVAMLKAAMFGLPGIG